MKKYELVFMVKNDAHGQQTIELMQEALNRTTYKMTLRGRHSSRKSLYNQIGKEWRRHSQNDVPVRYAERIACYIVKKNPLIRSYSR